jgi:tetratricopeptide (TPR) repeat protein
VSIDDEIEAAWTRGELRRAFELSSMSIATAGATGAPYREESFPLEVATRLYKHAERAAVMARDAEGCAAVERAIALRRSTLGPEHADTIDAEILGERLSRRGTDTKQMRRVRAEHCLALLDRMRALGDDLRTAIAGKNIAGVAYAADVDRAKMLAEHAVAFLQDEAGHEREFVDARLVQLQLLRSSDDHTRGLALAPRVVEHMERCWNAEHPFVAAAELEAGRLDTHAKQYRSARRRLKRGLRLAELGFGVHPLLAHLLRALSENEQSSGDNDEAWFYEQRAYDVLEIFAPERRGEHAVPFGLFLYETNRHDQLVVLLVSLERELSETQLGYLAPIGVYAYYRRDHARTIQWLERAMRHPDTASIVVQWGEALLPQVTEPVLRKRLEDALAKAPPRTTADESATMSDESGRRTSDDRLALDEQGFANHDE